MSKPIATYDGGIHGRVQAAVRSDGQVFRRYQNKGRWGYAWSAWKRAERIPAGAIPEIMESGFSTLFRKTFSARIPND